MSARLSQLLFEHEVRILQRQMRYKFCPTIAVKNLTISDLSAMALTLIQTERGDGPLPEMVLSAEAINILTKRAIEKNLPIL